MSYWNNTVAVGLQSGDIAILNAITGSKTSVLSGHGDPVYSVTFSSNGVFLASGSFDKTVKLWDIQTGGIIKTFLGHEGHVNCVSISADSTMLASASGGHNIRLWDIQTGKCNCIIGQGYCDSVCFYPMDSQSLVVTASGVVWQWSISDHRIGPPYAGSHVAFSLDGTQFALCNGLVVTVQHTESRELIGKFHTKSDISHCCFSPNGRLIAVATFTRICVWDITSSDTHPIEEFVGHSEHITSLTFSSPSTLISSSQDRLVKFWHIDPSLRDPVELDLQSTAHSSNMLMSVTLQAADGITITSDLDGDVRTWDIFTGHCKKSFQTPLKGNHTRDVRLIDGRLIIVWHEYGRNITMWDVEKQELLMEIAEPAPYANDLKISRDGSKVFTLDLLTYSINAFSIYARNASSSVQTPVEYSRRDWAVEGSKVWVCNSKSEWMGWDFEIMDSPIQLSGSPSMFHSNGTILWDRALFGVQDVASGKIVFQLNPGLDKSADVQWKDQFLVVCFRSGEVWILDFSYILLH